MRNINPFTERQIRLLDAVRERIRQLNDPEPELIAPDLFEWGVESTIEFGHIPKIKFRPNCTRTKAELVKEAGILDESKQLEISRLREKFGIKHSRNREARLFESEWNNIMLKAKKAIYTIGYLNQLFATNAESVSEPVCLLQSIVMQEYAPHLSVKRGPIHSVEEKQISPDGREKTDVRRYDEELLNSN